MQERQKERERDRDINRETETEKQRDRCLQVSTEARKVLDDLYVKLCWVLKLGPQEQEKCSQLISPLFSSWDPASEVDMTIRC